MASVLVRRLAALSGTAAVGAGAYGAHGRNITLCRFLRLVYFKLPLTRIG